MVHFSQFQKNLGKKKTLKAKSQVKGATSTLLESGLGLILSEPVQLQVLQEILHKVVIIQYILDVCKA